MKYAGIIKNDVASAPGVCVSFFTQGCPHHCPGCHNPETWDFNGGKDFSEEILYDIIDALQANGVKRRLAIMGGEPLCPENLELVDRIIEECQREIHDLEVYIWTGYTYEELDQSNIILQNILHNTTCLIDGKYEESLRDITLDLRGSSNQRIIYLTNK